MAFVAPVFTKDKITQNLINFVYRFLYKSQANTENTKNVSFMCCSVVFRALICAKITTAEPKCSEIDAEFIQIR